MLKKKQLAHVVTVGLVSLIIIGSVWQFKNEVGNNVYNTFQKVLGYELFPAFQETTVNPSFKLIELHEEIEVLGGKLKAVQGQNRALGGRVYALENPPVIPIPAKKVLVVVGHRSSDGGAAYKSLTEYSLNSALGVKLYNKLQADSRFKVTLSHYSGDYSPFFLNYFEKNKQSISNYRANKKEAYLKANPAALSTTEMDHNTATSFGITALYGINKWSVENNYDLVIHIHFNDYPRSNMAKAGQYTGFAVYVPLKANSNFTSSVVFAKKVEHELLQHFSRSTHPKEASGILESELIAMGSFNTLGSIPAVLVEGGYIYETQYQTASSRERVLGFYASDMYNALVKYFYP